MHCCPFASINLKVQFNFQWKLTRCSEKHDGKKAFFFSVSWGLKHRSQMLQVSAIKCLANNLVLISNIILKTY